MKNLILIFICLTFLTGYSQEKVVYKYLLNGKETEFENVYINPLNIDSLYIEKKSNVKEVYIVSEKQIEFINLDSVLQNYTELENEQNKTLFIIENKVIISESKVLIDKTYLINVKINHLDDIDYLDETFKKLIIVDISLKTKQEIMLRGENGVVENIISK